MMFSSCSSSGWSRYLADRVELLTPQSKFESLCGDVQILTMPGSGVIPYPLVLVMITTGLWFSTLTALVVIGCESNCGSAQELQQHIQSKVLHCGLVHSKIVWQVSFQF